ncbi:NAD kinase [Rossellomorea marisflavi]|jgi:NAD+ kinase|uniref:NAD kinase n=1 Tax=Rossellomorea marisflavi TaxID=189381 RepID=A0A0M0GMD8_9BACI|nr:NAD kinase [Rossellomorea marisflavi]KON91095.1 inorganic polyphosphate kinase [Rossellomorea marisflavi]MCM2589603.1 NAD kinase [Rossellomorea marisflavi]MDR4935934.1 NAD kinase [Rossellomorea marisflavi]UTE74096.1 NAD kinase [Rossellomorea marisflavi]GLI83770.1 NAD kinase 2 [Rossellomorea marisflavi]
MNRRNIYFYHLKDAALGAKLDSLYELARRYDFTIVNRHEDASIIVSVGGDGTFLQAVRKTGFRQDCLYAGISTGGTLSMYCDFHIDDTSKMIEAMTKEQIEVRKYPTIEVTVDHQTSFLCLNEFSIRSGIIKTFVMDVFIDDNHFETFRGDGMVIATPTGSTAYNKSVNGAVVDPMIPCLQVSEMASLNNNRYRTLGSSFILSQERRLVLKIVQDGNDYPAMGMDNEALGIQHVETIEAKLSGNIIKTVKLKDNSFWEKVKRSFL